MIRDAGRLMHYPRFKPLAVKHDERLARQRFDSSARISYIFIRLFPNSACKFLTQIGVASSIASAAYK